MNTHDSLLEIYEALWKTTYVGFFHKKMVIFLTKLTSKYVRKFNVDLNNFPQS
jgi:hypothetical protein